MSKTLLPNIPARNNLDRRAGVLHRRGCGTMMHTTSIVQCAEKPHCTLARTCCEGLSRGEHRSRTQFPATLMRTLCSEGALFILRRPRDRSDTMVQTDHSFVVGHCRAASLESLLLRTQNAAFHGTSL